MKMLRRSKTSSCLSLDTASCGELPLLASSPDSVGLASFGLMGMSSPSPDTSEEPDTNNEVLSSSCGSDECGSGFFSPDKHQHHESNSRNHAPEPQHQHLHSQQHNLHDQSGDTYGDFDVDVDYLLAGTTAIDLNAVADEEINQSQTIITTVLSPPRSPLNRKSPWNSQNYVTTTSGSRTGSANSTPTKRNVYISAKRLQIAQHWALEHQFPVEIVISSSSCLSPALRKGGQ